MENVVPKTQSERTRRSVAAMALAIILPGMVAVQISAADTAGCINAINKGMRKVTLAATKETRSCVAKKAGGLLEGNPSRNASRPVPESRRRRSEPSYRRTTAATGSHLPSAHPASAPRRRGPSPCPRITSKISSEPFLTPSSPRTPS